MNKNEFVGKKEGLIIIRLNPEKYFGIKINSIKNYHYYLGLMHGELLKEEIQEMRDRLSKFLKETRGTMGGKIIHWVLQTASKRMKKFISSEYLTEMNGVADGAGVKRNFILLINVFDELKNCLPGCSALAAEEDGRLLYGVNLDYAVFGDFLGPRNTVFIYQQKEPNHNFVSVAWPGYVGLNKGMNDQGTVLISLASYSTDQRIKGVPTSFLYREIIENFNTVSSSATKPRTIGNNILIGNKKRAVVIEVSANNLSTRMTELINGRKFITVTNHYQTSMSQYQRPPKPAKGSTIPKDKEEKWFWNFFGLKGSKKRNDTLQRLIRNYLEYFKNHPEKSEKFSPEIIKEILAEVANLYATINSMVFDPANLELYIANNSGNMPATDGKLVKINVGNLFKL